MRSNLIYIAFLTFLLSPPAIAISDFPIGLYEGSLGNSGMTLADSTAPSAYNPSLLSLRTESSISIGGNTVGYFKAKTGASSLSGSTLSPSYLSAIQIFSGYAHEFYIKNSRDLNINQESTEGTIQTKFDYRERQTEFGYSFAFPGFPMGFQFEGTYDFVYGNGQFEELNGTEQSVRFWQLNSSAINLRTGISTILRFKSYSLGANFKSRSLAVSSRDDSTFKNYLYSSNLNSFSTESGELNFNLQSTLGNSVEIGHGFQSGVHQFLTDTQLTEKRSLGQSYVWRQSYGYRYGAGEDHQFLCGLSHLIDEQISYFGQDAYYSVGYSWKTRTYRSAIGAFVLNKKLSQNTQVYGLNFSSEFNY